MIFPELNKKQIEKLSDITSDLALIAIAVVVLPAVFDKYDQGRVVLGIVISIILWIISLWLRK